MTGTEGGGVATAGGGGGLAGGAGGGGAGGGDAGGLGGGAGGGGGDDGCVGWPGRRLGGVGEVSEVGAGELFALGGELVTEASRCDAYAPELPPALFRPAVDAVCFRGFGCRLLRARLIVTMRAEGGAANHDGSYGRPP